MSYCCGAQEGSQQAQAGCCKGPLIMPEFGGYAVPEQAMLGTASNSKNTSSSSILTASSSSSFLASSTILATQSTVSNATRATAAEPSSNLAPSSKNSAATETGVGMGVEQTSKPAQPPDKGIPIGIGVGVGAPLLSGLVLLFLRERNRRIRAQKMADDAYRAAQEREKTGVRGYELYGHSLPQELA